jgi:hypothetical protein
MNRNKNIRNTSGYKGVTLIKNRYEAQIKIDGKKLYLGRYLTALEASEVYNKKAKELFGEFFRDIN